MKTTALSLEQTPPLRVPLRYFLTAPFFGVLAALLLLWYGGDALASRWMPPVLASAHFITLGFLAMVMAGAVQQLLPVLVASAVPWAGPSSAIVHWTLTVGSSLLGAAFLSGREELMALAMAALGIGMAYFIAVVAYCLANSRSNHATVAAMALAVAALAVTVLLGLLLAGGHALTAFPVMRRMTDLHLIWGMLGWVGLLIVAVSYQVVPMFQLTANYPDVWMRWLPRGVFLGLVVWGAGMVWPQWAWMDRVGGAIVVVGYLAFAILTFWLQRGRRRRLSDVHIHFWYLALFSLTGAMAVWVTMGCVPSPRMPMLMGVLFLVGFAMSVVSGMLYKIVPFLIWLHINNRMQTMGIWDRKIPNMKEILPIRRIRWHFWLHFGSLWLLVCALFWPHLMTRPAAMALMISFLLLWWNLREGVRLYRRFMDGLPPSAGEGKGADVFPLRRTS